MPGIEQIAVPLAIALVAIGIFGILQAMVVKYVRKYEHEVVHRYLEAEARKVSEDVADIMAESDGTDAELADSIRPAGMPERSEDSGETT
jgi:hypothetical protein